MSGAKRVLVPYRSEERVKPYLLALSAAGLKFLPHDVDKPATLAHAQGLLLMGGTDVDPRLYGREPQPDTDPPDRERDNNELSVLKEALAFDIPVLAICRGAQLLNIYQGGTLVQHLGSERHDPELEDRASPAHDVEIHSGNLLFDAVATATIGVNSRHHQAIGSIGDCLRVCAVDPLENVIEAIDFPGRRWVLGVQWHPEDQISRSAAAVHLFDAFARAVHS